MKKTLLLSCLSMLLPLAAQVELVKFKNNSSSDWDSAFKAASARDRVIRIPRGKYSFAEPIVITRDTRLIFEEGPDNRLLCLL